MRLFLTAFVLILTGCSYYIFKAPPTPPGTESFPEVHHYTNAMNAFEKGDFKKSYLLFKKFLSRFPSSIRFQSARFYSAYSVENTGNYEKAIEIYRAVLRTSQTTHPKLASHALIRLSYCYENLGKDLKVIANLKDALKHKRALSEEIWRAEIPARLAAAYSRIQNHKDADKYYAQAEEGLQYLKRRNKGAHAPAWWSKTLFQMGHFSMGEITLERFQEVANSLERLQLYLLQSAEVGDKKWSPKAKDSLLQRYQALWDFIITLPIDDHIDQETAFRAQNKKQKQMGKILLANVVSLRTQRLPQELEKGSLADEIFQYLHNLESNIHSLIQTGLVETDLTPEAKKLEQLKLPGQLVSPEDNLEKQLPQKKEDVNL